LQAIDTDIEKVANNFNISLEQKQEDLEVLIKTREEERDWKG